MKPIFIVDADGQLTNLAQVRRIVIATTREDEWCLKALGAYNDPDLYRGTKKEMEEALIKITGVLAEADLFVDIQK